MKQTGQSRVHPSSCSSVVQYLLQYTIIVYSYLFEDESLSKTTSHGPFDRGLDPVRPAHRENVEEELRGMYGMWLGGFSSHNSACFLREQCCWNFLGHL